MNKYYKQRLSQLINDVRIQLRCNDANVKMMHPEKSSYTLSQVHSSEMGNIHINNTLVKMEFFLGLEVNNDVSTVLSDRNSYYSLKGKQY